MTNPLDFLIRRSPIAGLEISESAVRIALLEMGKGKNARVAIKTLAEEELPEGTLTDGRVTDTKGLTEAIRRLVTGAGITTKYVVASIPVGAAYARVFSFPENVSGEKLEQTMNLTIGFHLPVRPEDVHLDWEKIEGDDGEVKEIFLAAAAKDVVTGFLEAVKNAGLKVVALEIHPASFARVADLGAGATIVRRADTASTAFYVLKNGAPRFMRTVPNAAGKVFLKGEAQRIKNFYEFENGPVSDILDYETLTGARAIVPEGLEGEARWLVALGAAARGLLPRSEDTLVSVMPLGTELAYEYQKLATFSNLLSNIAVGVAAFFATAYLGAWIMMLSLQMSVTSGLQNASMVRVAPEMAGLEDRATAFNERVASLAGIVGTIPRWSLAVELVSRHISDGITISALSMPAPSAVFSMTGIAATRDSLNAFKRSMEEEPQFAEVAMPLVGIGMRKNIPFSVSFRLKDPQVLYQY
ncbi:MAG: pilus assembly protein PilM [Candidatus Niyogibacteria bacterium]|nr:pilus assembly protein PilM [Candidatus Niyogibacteria bacterium]